MATEGLNPSIYCHSHEAMCQADGDPAPLDENTTYYNKVVELCRNKGWQATLCAISEEGRPNDGTDWKAMYERWTKEKSDQQSLKDAMDAAEAEPLPIDPQRGSSNTNLTKFEVVDRRRNYDDNPVEFTHSPIGDYLVVRRIPEPEGLIVEADVAKDKPINCEVVAVSQHPSSDLASAALQSIHTGDKVLIRRYSGTEVKVNGIEYTLVMIFDVLLKLGGKDA